MDEKNILGIWREMAEMRINRKEGQIGRCFSKDGID